jgi:protein-arginine kinase activator protein McsA
MADPTIVLTATDNASRVLANVRGQIDKLNLVGAKLGNVLGGLGAGLSAGALAGLVKGINDGVDALNDLKDASGASIENISALEDIAARTGTSFDTVGAALVKFNGVLKDARPGSQAEAALKGLNLSVEELQKLDPAEALRRTAVALAGFADDGNKARRMQELFGKSLREVAPFLSNLATQGRLVATVTAEQAAEAEKFNLQLFQMQKNAQDLGRILTSDLITGINNAAAALKQSGLIEGFRTLVTGDDRYKNNKALFEQTEILLNLEKALQDQRGQGFAEDSRVVNNTKAQIAGIKEQLRVTQNYRKVLDTFASAPAVAGPLPSLGGTAGGPTKTQPVDSSLAVVRSQENAMERYMETLKRTLEAEQDLTEVQKARIRIAENLGRTTNAIANQAILGIAEEIDKQRELKKAIQEAVREGAELDAGLIAGEEAAQAEERRRAQERQAQLKGLLSNTDEERLARIRENVELLAEEFSAGRLAGGVEQYIQAVQNAVGQTGETVEKTKSLVDDLGLSFSSAFEDAIVGGAKLSDVLKGVGQDLLRLTIRKSITEPLGGFFTSALGGLLSFDGGGYTGSGARAGGLDGKGGFLSVLHPRETIIDHTKGGAAGASIVNYNSFTVGDVASVSMVEKALANSERKMFASTMRSMQYGGALA